MQSRGSIAAGRLSLHEHKVLVAEKIGGQATGGSGQSCNRRPINFHAVNRGNEGCDVGGAAYINQSAKQADREELGCLRHAGPARPAIERPAVVNKIAVGYRDQKRNGFEETKPNSVAAPVRKKNEKIQYCQIEYGIDKSHDDESLDFDEDGTLARLWTFGDCRHAGINLGLQICWHDSENLQEQEND